MWKESWEGDVAIMLFAQTGKPVNSTKHKDEILAKAGKNFGPQLSQAIDNDLISFYNKRPTHS